ncbi:DNA-protecting protein DprA [Deferribacteraceae bacterium V6Fe1]|nr:DNA-protecting protein DprA [Deferribacteraceae bacterium V6Fe1]
MRCNIDFQVISNYLKLKRIKGVSPKNILSIVDTFGSIEKIFNIKIDELVSIGIKENIAKEIVNINHLKDDFVEEQLRLIKKHNVTVLVLEDEDYPEELRNIYDPPPVLFAYGKLDCLKRPKIAIVGARKSSERAKKIAAKIACDLAETGINIVSGFAAGVDISAHIGASEKGSTTAVFGCGLLTVYPATNKRYLKKILENGVIVSEYWLTEPPNWYNFPQRNRIISGLSLGTLVVEASKKSGSLITAKLALEQNRELYAIPTFPDSINSATNFLIKNGAILVENYLDIIENTPQLLKSLKVIDKKEQGNIIELTDKTRPVFDLIAEQPLTSNELMLKVNMDFMELMTCLTELELNNLIKRGLDGKYYIY